MIRLLPWRSLGVAAAALAVAASAAAPGLTYDRDRILGGEIWRLLTGHLVHAGPRHLLWDALPLLGVGLLFEGALGSRFWRALGMAALSVGAGLFLLDPGLGAYCGLSGVLNGLWVGGALVAARGEERAGRIALAWLYRACVLLDLGKVAFETATGSPLVTDPIALGGDPVPLAHALGALGGVLAAWRSLAPRERAPIGSAPGGSVALPA